MGDTQILLIVVVVGIMILSLSVHEAAHAYVARLCGDDTAEREGRLTLNPIAHIDPMMTIVVPILLYVLAGFWFGGAKPVPVNPQRLRHPTRDMMFVAIAGPLSNLLQGLLYMVLWKVAVNEFGYDTEALLPQALWWAVMLNVLLAVFNMLPLPPLDGSRVMAYFLPSPLREKYVELERFGMILIVVVVFLIPGVDDLLFSAMATVFDGLNAVTGGRWS